MARASAGLLLFRRREGLVEVLLVHPGGPFYARRDAGVWSIPKGEFTPPEDAEAAARREFHEETGVQADAPCIALGTVVQRAGKVVTAFAMEGDLDASAVRSNVFEMEYPPRSGRMARFPEVDRAGWFGLEAARAAILPAQSPFLDRLAAILAGSPAGPLPARSGPS